MTVPHTRIRSLNDHPVQPDGDHVLYWMVATRRTQFSFALQRAVELALELDRPLIVLEPLRIGYRWASDRIHRFVIDGMADQAAFFAERPVAYYPYVEPSAGAGQGLLEALAENACAVVTDDWPCFFVPRMQDAAAARVQVRMESVDSNGLVPIRAADKGFARAFDFRRYLHRVLPDHLEAWPEVDPSAQEALRTATIPETVTARWPPASQALLSGDPDALAALPIDHEVFATEDRGGHRTARKRLESFVTHRLARYADRNHPDEEAASTLSPWLHFGHIGTHEILLAIAEPEGWSPADVNPDAKGKRVGFWGTSEATEGFLDQVVTWRELGFNACVHLPDYDRYQSLPPWARRTLDEHRSDPRQPGYTFELLERAASDDPIWNAAQRELRETGRMQNYLRMLWGKKILEWAPTPEDAADWMVRLNDRWALDGRDPNSYSGIFWVLGRFDRAWGPERPIFGKIRYMTSASTRRKLRVNSYLERWSASQP